MIVSKGVLSLLHPIIHYLNVAVKALSPPCWV
jgi:hypothetical protein